MSKPTISRARKILYKAQTRADGIVDPEAQCAVDTLALALHELLDTLEVEADDDAE